MADEKKQDFEQVYDQAVKAVDTAMEGYLAHEPNVPDVLRKSMLYSLRAGGKRLRPALVMLSCRVCGGDEMAAIPAAAAIEMIHTYSLIHDDLPAMDDDDFRRGQPSNHKVFGDGVAILAGDALLTCAFGILAQHTRKDSLVRQLVIELAQAAGAAGMIGGQVEDLLYQNKQGDLETVSSIHTHKTAMMFFAATKMGAMCAETPKKTVDLLGDYGLRLGLAFQIIDDILDVTASSQQMGKTAKKDAQAGKLTWPAVVGVENSRRQADKYIEEAIAALAPLGEAADPLRSLARKLANRTH
jgi:geranylgeranyl diphosphate synthase, type II